MLETYGYFLSGLAFIRLCYHVAFCQNQPSRQLILLCVSERIITRDLVKILHLLIDWENDTVSNIL